MGLIDTDSCSQKLLGGLVLLPLQFICVKNVSGSDFGL